MHAIVYCGGQRIMVMELVLSFHYVYVGDQTQIGRLGSKHLDLLSHPGIPEM